MQGLRWRIQEADIARFVKIYRDEFRGKNYATSTDRLFSFLKDYPNFQSISYVSQVKLWFWLLHHGVQ